MVGLDDAAFDRLYQEKVIADFPPDDLPPPTLQPKT